MQQNEYLSIFFVLFHMVQKLRHDLIQSDFEFQCNLEIELERTFEKTGYSTSMLE